MRPNAVDARRARLGSLDYFVEKLARESIIVDMKITQEEELAWHYQQSR